MVDGLGISGCEGTFRKSCEEVLRVLRENALQVRTYLRFNHNSSLSLLLYAVNTKDFGSALYPNCTGVEAPATFCQLYPFIYYVRAPFLMLRSFFHF